MHAKAANVLSHDMDVTGKASAKVIITDTRIFSTIMYKLCTGYHAASEIEHRRRRRRGGVRGGGGGGGGGGRPPHNNLRAGGQHSLCPHPPPPPNDPPIFSSNFHVEQEKLTKCNTS